ncbi:hypothetical protein DRE_06984 [Drechslerella stenobrocha 248]|uniref:Uncharacterized protein n=1 Tax=Drechslerella stenobrocha 248 TaxID=1043628 RepID=W7HM36_9PEZI|nr:hypothetical protein DRE_06984 [Drechslerella stenobrocha 248]
MVSSSFISYAVSFGLLGLQAFASPLVDPKQITPLKPISEDDLLAGSIPVSELQKRSIAESMKNALEMLPIEEDELLPSHLRKRSTDLSRLDLKQDVKMIYAAISSESQIYMANMTLHQPDADHPLILMERFDGLLQDVACGSSDIKLTFNGLDAMDYAIKAWDWVNEDEEDHFFLITKHEGCSRDSQRTPFKIDKVKYDRKSFSAVLTTTEIAWEQLASDFDISLGSANMPNRLHGREIKSSDITKTGFFDSISTFGGDKTVYWDLTIGDVNGGRTSILSDVFHQWKRVEVSCVNCYLSGGLEITGYIKVEQWNLKKLMLGAKPKNLKGRLELEVVIRSALPDPGIQFDQSLFEAGIPGISIPGIFTLGPSIQYQVGMMLSTAGFGNFSVGVATMVPNEASILANILDFSQSSAKGFENTVLKPIFKLNDMTVMANAFAYAQPVVAFGVKVLTKFGVEAALELKLPYINVDIATGYNKNGYCPDDKQRRVSGAKSTSGANIDLWLKAAKFTGFPSMMPNMDRKLWGVRWPFFETCIPTVASPPAIADPDSPTGTAPEKGDITAIPDYGKERLPAITRSTIEKVITRTTIEKRAITRSTIEKAAPTPVVNNPRVVRDARARHHAA